MFSSRVCRHNVGQTAGKGMTNTLSGTKKLPESWRADFHVYVTDKITVSANQQATVSLAQRDSLKDLLRAFFFDKKVKKRAPVATRSYGPSSEIDVRTHFMSWSTQLAQLASVKQTDLSRTLLCSASLVNYIEIEVNPCDPATKKATSDDQEQTTKATSEHGGDKWTLRVAVIDPPKLAWLKMFLGILLGLFLAAPPSGPERLYDYEPDAAQCAKMEEILRRCSKGKLTVLTGQRGQGKTTTAQHVARQYHLRCSVIYINAKKMNDEQLFNTLKYYQTILSRFWEHAAGCVAMPLSVALSRSPSALCATMSFFVAVATRPRVVIVDDFTTSRPSTDEVKKRLDEIIRFSEEQRALLLSSNEGVNACFEDTAEEVRDEVWLPDASPLTIEKYLVKKLGLQKDDAKKIVNYADAHLSRHWSRSFRFYAALGKKGKLSDYLLPKEEAPDDEPLLKVPLDTWAHVAVSLDLETAPTTRPVALALSPSIEPDKRKELVKLLRVPDDSIPEDCPRRLALAHALAARKEELIDRLRTGIIHRLACDVTQQKLNQAKELIEDGDIRNAFVGDLAPILENYDKGFHDNLLAALGNEQPQKGPLGQSAT